MFHFYSIDIGSTHLACGGKNWIEKKKIILEVKIRLLAIFVCKYMTWKSDCCGVCYLLCNYACLYFQELYLQTQLQVLDVFIVKTCPKAFNKTCMCKSRILCSNQRIWVAINR